MFNFCPNCGAKTNKNKDEFSFKCESCQKTFYLNAKPTASVIPYCGDEILLNIRARDPGKGKLDIIGGFLNPDEEPLAGAVREFKEETGMEINKEDLEYLGIWIGHDYDFEGSNYYTFNVNYMIKFSEKLKLTPQDDVADLVWIKAGSEKDLAFKYAVEVLKAAGEKLA